MILVQIPIATSLVFSILVGLLIIKFTALLVWFMDLHAEKKLLSWIFVLGFIVALGTMTAIMAILLLAPNSLPLFESSDYFLALAYGALLVDLLFAGSIPASMSLDPALPAMDSQNRSDAVLCRAADLLRAWVRPSMLLGKTTCLVHMFQHPADVCLPPHADHGHSTALTKLWALPPSAWCFRWFVHPVVSGAGFTIIFSAWHVPDLYEWAYKTRACTSLST